MPNRRTLLLALSARLAAPLLAVRTLFSAPLVASIVLAPTTGSAQPSAAPTADSVARVDAVFAAYASDTSPGCAVAVARGGKTLLSRAYGMASLEYSVPNTPETVFEAGSVSKQFTAAAVALLAQEGRLSPDEPVQKYLPEIPEYGQRVTVRNLLNHTSGIRDWGPLVAAAGWPRGTRVMTQAHVLDLLSKQRALNFPPGSEYLYSTSNYNLLAILASRVSGEALPAYTARRLFQPLGMTHTQWRDDHTRIVRGRATAYSREPDGFHSDMPFENAYGNGGLLTTVADLLRWNESFVTHAVGGPALAEELQRRGRLTSGRQIDYAEGLVVSQYRGLPEVSHSGSTGGYRAFLARYPRQTLSLALLCNLGSVNPTALGHRVIDIFLAASEVTDAPVPPPVRVPAAELRARAGLYRDVRTGEPLRLVAGDGTLRIDGGDELVPMSRTAFRDARGEMRASFAAADGHPSTIRVVSSDGDTVSFVSVSPAAPSVTQLAEYAGEYRSDEIETTYRLAVEGDSLVARRRPDAAYRLRPSYGDAFVAQGLGLVLFHRDARGRVDGLSLGLGRVRDLPFVRVQASAAAEDRAGT